MATRPSEELIFDRSANDVQQNNAKGNWNISDLERIELWQNYLKELLAEYGYNVPRFEETPTWTITYLPRLSDINKVKNNLQKLKDTFYVLQSTPSVPSTERNFVTYQDANDIEKIMSDMDYLISSMVQYFIYCGVARCGQNRIYQQRFRRY